MENNRIVLDTNVVISALISSHGFPFKIIDELVFNGEVTICLSPDIWEEYQAVCSRDKFKNSPKFYENVPYFLTILKQLSLFCYPEEKLSVLNDEPDNRILEAAIAAKAAYIITGNTNDFTFSEFRGIQILNPKEFYETWEKQKS